jgi:hypothetical protein
MKPDADTATLYPYPFKELKDPTETKSLNVVSEENIWAYPMANKK